MLEYVVILPRHAIIQPRHVLPLTNPPLWSLDQLTSNAGARWYTKFNWRRKNVEPIKFQNIPFLYLTLSYINPVNVVPHRHAFTSAGHGSVNRYMWIDIRLRIRQDM